MNIYVDCEFNGFGGGLISMALVADDGREWYSLTPAFLSLADWEPWVRENVYPVLLECAMPEVPSNWHDFRASLKAFLDQYDNPNIVADWYTDLMHFFQCFQGADHTDSFAVRCTAELRTDLEEYKSEFPHNALSDARAIRGALSEVVP